MKSAGKQDAGNPHVRFDERGRKTERSRKAQATAPFLDSTIVVPAEHWKHLRTTNPIESTFATVCHRTIRAKGCLSNKTALAMVFKLVEGVQRTWRRLDGHHQLPKLIEGVTFANGVQTVGQDAQATAA
jgi:transposase-like protein